MAAAKEEEFTEEEVEVAAILCDLNKVLRARERRWRRRMQRLMPAAPEIPSWGRRRPRSMPEEKPAAAPAPAPAPALAPERDGAASPDTPLAYPESGGDDAPAEEEDAKKPISHEQWVHEQQAVVASLSQENAHLLKQIEEYRARLQSSRSTNESLKQLHKVKREQEEQEQARKRPRVEAQAPAPAAADPRAAALGLGLDLNEPARAPELDEQARAQLAQAAAAAAAAEWYRRAQLQGAMRKAAVSAGARRRRLEILRAKVACPLVSSKPRRVG